MPPGVATNGSPEPAGGSFDRAEALARMAAEQFDLLVIGGGVTGAGVALDAASRGLSTALVEKGDFASGTSSKSSKLVHGGLRYLQQHEFKLVYENLAERQLLLQNAPHLVSPLSFLLPLFGRHGVVSRTVVRSYGTALWLYDLTGGWRIGRRHHRVTKAQALQHLPVLRSDRLVAGFMYPDAQADDARLTLTLLRTAAFEYGAAVANYAGATELLTEGGKVAGARVRPGCPGGDAETEIEIRARVVVNAAGVWSDEVRSLDPADHGPALRPAKGVHVTVPGARLPCDTASVLPVPKERRTVFVIPWPDADLVYIGTTDTDYDGPLDDPRCGAADVDYLLGAVNAATTVGLTREDVTGVWAGLRPLLAGPAGGAGSAGARPTDNRPAYSERTADLSRRHTVRSSPSGLITVTGGKLTTYRRMAEDTVDRVVEALGQHRRCVTSHLRLRGAVVPYPSATGGTVDRLTSRYGHEASAVLALASERPELLEPAIEGLPYLRAELVYAARAEMAVTLEDVLGRRTRALIQHAPRTMSVVDELAELVGVELGWSTNRVSAEAQTVRQLVKEEFAAAGLASPDVRPAGTRPR